MGGSESKSHYLKMKITNDRNSASFLYWDSRNDKYSKTIVYSYPDYMNITTEDISESNYNSSNGDYFQYNGDFNKMSRLFQNHNPATTSVQTLISRLYQECDLHAYESLFKKIKNWLSTYVVEPLRLLSPFALPLAIAAK